jgi:hypothetical protein
MIKFTKAQSSGIIASVSLLIMAYPATAETLEINGLYPARYADASTTRTIYVERLSGNAGTALQYELSSRLAEVHVNEDPWFDLRYGRRTSNADAQLSGFADVNIVEGVYFEQRSKCIERDGNKKCTKKEKWSEKCFRRSITLSASISLTKGGRRSLYSDRKSETNFDSSCEGPIHLIAEDDAVDALLALVADDISRDIAPQYRQEKVRVSENRKDMPEAIAQQFKQAVKYTKSDPTAACQLWTDIDNQMPNSGSVIYNLALCAEQRDELDKADALYSRAQAIMPDLKKAVTGPQRIQARRHAAEIYGQQLAVQ